MLLDRLVDHESPYNVRVTLLDTDEVRIPSLYPEGAEPEGVVGFFEEIQQMEQGSLKNLKRISTHPVTDERIYALRNHAVALNILTPYHFS